MNFSPFVLDQTGSRPAGTFLGCVLIPKVAQEVSMSSNTRPQGYSTMQIVLHWLIAALVIFQVVFGENIAAAWRALRRGAEVNPDDAFNAQIHVYLGIAVLVLALWRLALRLRWGAPEAPAGESAIQRWIARATHVVLYLVIFGMPVSGGVAWYLGVGAAAEVHELAKPVIVVFVALHAAGALWQHFVGRTGVLVRMLRPARNS
jgi:cytochrome b561